MKRRTYVVLILTILILGVLYFLGRPATTVEASYSVPTDWHLPIDTSRVVRIEMRGTIDTMVVDRRHGTWRYAYGTRENADNLLVARFLEGIANFKLLGLVSSNPRKQDFFSVGETGTSVDITDDEGNHVSLVVGKMSSLPSRSYIRPSASDVVYLARGMTPDIFGGGTLKVSTQKVLRLGTAFIWSISIQSGQTGVTIRREGAEWLSMEQAVSDSMISPVMKTLEMIRGEETTVDRSLQDREPLIVVEIREQKRIKLEFYSRGLRDNMFALRTSLSQEYWLVDNSTVRPFQDLLNVVSLHDQASIAVPPTSPRAVSQRPSATLVANKPPKPSVPAIQIRSPEPSSLPLSRPPLVKTERETSTNSVEEEGTLAIHTVKLGESLETIAQQYSITKDQLKRWNLLTKDDVSPGTELYVFLNR